MSNSDSFIDEVTEEIRRDRLYGYLRKYGWIGLVLVVGIVGGTAFVEWDKSRKAQIAQSFGDAMLDALDTGSVEDRQAAFAAVPAQGEQAVIRDLIASADRDADKPTALAQLDAVIAMPNIAPELRDLAILRRVGLAGSDQPLAERRAALEPLAVAGRPYRAMAAEQLAWLLIEDNKTDEAIAALKALLLAQDSSAALRARSSEVIIALGGNLAANAETAPEGEVSAD